MLEIPQDILETSQESLRTEIIESQKVQADYLKWKLIAVGGIGTLVFTTAGHMMLVCLVPVLCAYIDLLSLHLMIRIITIGAYLAARGNRYERYIFEIRKMSGLNPFVFEVSALHGSSLGFDLIIVGIGFYSLITGKYLSAPMSVTYMFWGMAGVFWTVLLFILYGSRERELCRLAREIVDKIVGGS